MTLPRFAQLLGGCSLTSFRHWGCSFTSFSRWGCSSLRFVARGTLPRFAQSLRDAPSFRSVAGGAPRFASSLGGRSLASLSLFPFNGSIKLLQNLHSRGPTKQHFCVWEPRCGYLHKVAKILIHHIENCARTPMFYTTTAKFSSVYSITVFNSAFPSTRS